ncbi:MAG: peptidylprolyl isomerase [Oscillospiraceae bacterium]|nr:peptidylprolyl isomerase [Oscillospiraceae bacterium]
MSNDFEPHMDETEQLPEEQPIEPAEAEPEETPVQEEPLEQAAEAETEQAAEDAPEAEEVSADDAPEEAPLTPAPKKKKIGGWIALAVVLVCAAVCAVLYFSWLNGTALPTEQTEAAEAAEEPDIVIKGIGSVSIEADGATEDVMKTVVAVNRRRDFFGWVQSLLPEGGASEKNALTNAQLAVHYWNAVYQFSNQYYYFADSLGFDLQHMDTAEAEEGWTWQEFFLSSALSAFRSQNAAYQQSLAEGFALSEELQADYDSMVEELNGMEDIDQQLQTVYGPGVTLEDYFTVMKMNYAYVSYLQHYSDSLNPTEDELRAYYDENAEDYESRGIEPSDVAAVNVRHILIVPEDAENDESWTAAETRAQEIYERWKSEGATEDGFAELAEMESEDPGSKSTGGLYEGVYPGQMVEAFNDWCFDASRKTGDSGIVRTEYGFHIMYFVSAEDTPYWLTQIDADYRNAKTQEHIEALSKQYTISYDTSKFVIALPDQIANQE